MTHPFKRFSMALVSTLVLLLIAGPAAFGEEKNFLRDSGFEDADNSGSKALAKSQWSSYWFPVVRADTEAHSGRHSLKVSNNPKKTSPHNNIDGIKQDIKPPSPEDNYTMSCWMRSGSGKLKILMGMSDGNFGVPGSSKEFTIDDQWKKYEYSAKASPGRTFIRLAGEPGTFYVDDCVITKTSSLESDPSKGPDAVVEAKSEEKASELLDQAIKDLSTVSTKTEKNAKEDGVYKTYFPEGHLEKEVTYKDGEKINEKRYYKFTPGQISAEWNYQNGQPHGERKEYSHGGTLSVVYRYNNGRMEDGTYKILDDNGIARSEAVYKDGFAIAKKIRYEDGTMKLEFGPLEEPNLTFFKEYYENGQLKREDVNAENTTPRRRKRVEYFRTGEKQHDEVITEDKKRIERWYDKDGNIKTEKIKYLKFERVPHSGGKYGKYLTRTFDENGKVIKEDIS